MPNIWKNSIAKGEISSGPMKLKGGDADVFTQPGRKTKVLLQAHNIRLSNDNKAFDVDIHYEVYERHSDNTWFSWDGTVQCKLPLDAQVGSIYVADIAEYDRTFDIIGQHHEAMPVPGAEGTCIVNDSTFRIDGKGDDWTNAGIELKLAIPFLYYDTI